MHPATKLFWRDLALAALLCVAFYLLHILL